MTKDEKLNAVRKLVNKKRPYQNYDSHKDYASLLYIIRKIRGIVSPPAEAKR